MDVLSVDKIRKMNSLVKEFKKHGMSENSDNAVNEVSGKLYGEPSAQTNDTIAGEPMQPIVATGDDALIEQKYQLLMDMEKKKVEQEINSLRETISNLNNEIQVLRAELKHAAEQSNPKLKEKEKQDVLKTVPKEDHPRQGNYRPEDVSVEKMFYFGHK
jgi:hypothetical protein